MLEAVLAHADAILLVVTIVGGWIHLLRGGKVDGARSMLTSLAREVVHAEGLDLDDPAAREKIAQVASTRVQAWLAEHKISGVAAERLVKEAVATAVAELARLTSQRDMIAEVVANVPKSRESESSSMTTTKNDDFAPTDESSFPPPLPESPPRKLVSPAAATAVRSPAAGKHDKLGRDLVLRWRQYLLLHGDGSEDLGVIQGWILNESGGDTCSIGGGNLDEIGIVQFNVPKTGALAGRIVGESGADLGFTRAQIAGACHVDGSPPTEEEADVQAAASMALVRDCMGIARRSMAALGVKWAETSQDFWAAVKQSHASGQDAILELLPRAVKALGPTLSFAQFRTAAVNYSPASVASDSLKRLLSNPSKTGKLNRLDDCFANAIDTATYLDGTRPPKAGGAGGSDSEVDLLQATLDAMIAAAGKRGIHFVGGRWTRS